MIAAELLLPLAAMAVLTAWAGWLLGSWLAPGAFFALFWTCLTALSVSLSDYPVWGVALWWIDGCLFLFFVGSVCGDRLAGAMHGPRAASPDRQAPSRDVNLPYLPTALAAACMFALIYIVFRGYFAPTIIDAPPVWFQIVGSGIYAAPLLAGMLYAVAASPGQRRLAWLGFLPGAIFSSISLGRSPLLAAIFFWLAGYWPLRVHVGRGNVPLLTARTVILTPLLLAFLTFAAINIGVLRQVGVDQPLTVAERVTMYPALLAEADWQTAWEQFRPYVFGNPAMFSYYLRSAIDSPPTPEYGLLTFAGPVQVLGIRQRQYYESFEVDDDNMSNVYTLFMPPIEDFGIVGSFFSFLGAGLLAGWGFRRVADGDLRAVPILTMFYPHVMVIGGYFFSFNSIVLAHALVGGYIFWSVRRPRFVARPSLARAVR
jgi:hypothetical protein